MPTALSPRRGPSILAVLLMGGLTACAAEDNRVEAAPAPQAQTEMADAETTPVAAPSPERIEVVVPSGTYVSDPNHTSMAVSIGHLGLAPYAAYLSDVDVRVTLDVDDPDASAVNVTADAGSVFTSYRDDYSATHPDSDYGSWEEAISRQFLGADATPQITFTGTDVNFDGMSGGQVTGDLTMNGRTAPATFDIELTGQTAEHPFTKGPAIGMTATGTIMRSDYGIAPNMNGFLSDDVDIMFSADFILEADEG